MLGRKLNMTQVFRLDGTVVPVTRVQAGPLYVTQVKKQHDKTASVQVGFGIAKSLSKPVAGHLHGLPQLSQLREFATTQDLQRGDKISLESFMVGEKVDAIGTSKGKGFQGVVKRHGFAGGPATHGHKDNLRMPGSIGAGGVQRVFKGMRMGGHMGDERVTVQNLEIIEINPEKNEILLKGAVPGARNGLIILQAPGDVVVKKAATEVVAEPAPVETTEEVVVAEAVPTEETSA